jgi:integration host factor subunit alpha
MSPSANWQALTVRHTETVQQRDDCPFGQVSPRLGRRAIPASVLSLIFCASPSAKPKQGGPTVVPSDRVLWLGTFPNAVEGQAANTSPLTVSPAKLVSLIIQHDTFDDAYRSPTAGLVLSGKTVKRADLCEAVHQKVGLSRTEAATLVELVLKEIADCLERGETVTLSSFGSFVVRKKGQRIGRNPKTGEVVPISARRVTVFKPSPIFKQRINSR